MLGTLRRHECVKAVAQIDSLSRQLDMGGGQVVGGAGASRAMMLPGEVGAKISERDRLLREKQLRDAQSQRANQGRQGALRGIPLRPARPPVSAVTLKRAMCRLSAPRTC